MTHPHDLRSKYEDERTRAQEQSQILHLQNQIDELRRQLKDSNNKYSWAMEQVRKNEAMIAQVQGMVDKTSEENLQSLEAYRRELTTLRKEVANTILKVEEGIKPIRDLQTQIQHTADQRKRDQAQVSLWLSRIEALENSLLEYDTRIREGDERVRQFATQFDKLREVDEESAAEIQRLQDELQAEKQALRRQAIEAQQMVADTEGNIQELVSRISRHDQRIEEVASGIKPLPEQIDLLGQQIPEIIAELKRIERVSTDRFLMSQERIEELRSHQQETVIDLRTSEQEHNHELLAWLERLDGWCREYETKVQRAQTRIESLRIEYQERLQQIEVRERRTLDTLLGSLHQLAEQNHAEQLGSDSDSES